MAKTYMVMLMITPDDEDGHPDTWDWPTLLDLPWDNVILEDVRVIEES